MIIVEKVISEVGRDSTTPIHLAGFYVTIKDPLITLSDRLPLRIIAIENGDIIDGMAEVELEISQATSLKRIHRKLTKPKKEEVTEHDRQRAIADVKRVMIACCELYLTILLRMKLDPMDARKKLDDIEKKANYSKRLNKREKKKNNRHDLPTSFNGWCKVSSYPFSLFKAR